jgi:hypothetical protein
MKRIVILLVFSLVLLAVPFSMFAYDSSPSYIQVLPEAIWAAAAGGGTWTTEVQIYARNTADPVDLVVFFMYNGGGGLYRGPFTLSGLTVQNMTRYTNILQTIDNLDTGVFDYYGKVGSVWFRCVDANDRILVQGKTLHSGGYGKTMNALNTDAAGNYASFGPPWTGMMIQGITKNTTYRSSIGLFNAGTSSISVQVALIYSNDVWLGHEDITLAAYEFLSFDPFTRFGVAGPNSSCRVWVNPYAGTGKVIAFGASANNTTNDPSAHIAVAYD